VHSGPVSGVIDVNERANLAGAGINMAQRVMDCGDVGDILLSKHVAEDFEQYAGWKPLLHDLGECEVKHGVHVHVVNLHTDELGSAEPPEKFKNLRGKRKIGPVISASTARARGLDAARLCLSKTIPILALHGHGDSEHCKTFAGSASDHPGEAECAGKLAQAGGTPSRAIAFMRHTVIFLSLSRCRESL